MAKRRRKLTSAEAKAVFDADAREFQSLHEQWLATAEGNKLRLELNMARSTADTMAALSRYRKAWSAFAAAHYAGLKRNPLGRRKAEQMLKLHEYSSARQRRFLGARARGLPVKKAKRRRASSRRSSSSRRNPAGPDLKRLTSGWKVYDVREQPSGKVLGYVVARSEAEAHKDLARRMSHTGGLEVGELVAMLPSRDAAVEMAKAFRVSLARTRRSRSR